MKKIIKISLFFIIPFIICGCNINKKGSEEDIKKLLNNSINEEYEIINHVRGDRDEDDIYDIYLPESNLTYPQASPWDSLFLLKPDGFT